jgi:hypothetical protein
MAPTTSGGMGRNFISFWSAISVIDGCAGVITAIS